MIAGQPNRLANGGHIDRTRPLTFRFDDRDLTGFAGDTLASALLAADIHLVGRSFKYHRPRGILTAGSDEPNALVELRTGARREANTRATVIELFRGLEARSQNRWPSLAFDVGASTSLFSPLFVAGFYYKTFMWPKRWWERFYEPAIRRAAGLGRASHTPDPDSYDKSHAFCDVLVIGAGPSGLAAALLAARSGARVLLCDEDSILGGRLNGEQREIGGLPGPEWVRQIESELAGFPDVQILRRTTVFGTYDGGAAGNRVIGARTFGAVERVSDHLPEPAPHRPRQRLWKIVARCCVLAAGASERSLVFGGNDRPGVMLASAVRTYLHRYAVVPGRQVALFTSSDDGWQTAQDLAAAGATITAIVDSREQIPAQRLRWSESIGTQAFAGAQIVHTQGSRRLRGITVRDRNGNESRVAADALAVSGGWNPNIALTTHLGAKPVWSEVAAAFVPGTVPAGMQVVGSARGAYSLGAALREGSAAGAQASESLGLRAVAVPSWRADDEPAGISALWQVQGSRSKAFVDFQNDVTDDDVALAAREGYQSVELLKRYTTLGMATDQGRTSGVNGHAIMAAATGRSIAQVGTTTFRPPYTPVAIGALAGHHRGKHFRPTRLTAGHSWAAERGATFIEAGDWLRAQWFALAGETDWMQTITREVRATRSGVGFCDVSTLGKIDIQGPDAATLLDRLYINLFSTLPVGKTRYGLMLREDGFVMDDGTTARLGAEHYVMSTTTVNASRVMQHMEHACQVLWPGLDVQLASVSEQWAQLCLAGPRSREVLQSLLGDALDLSNTAFPYLACREFPWRGVRARLFRISFSGELAYELAVPASHGAATIRAIMAAGEPAGITPYGLESLNVMRIEKGHVTGNEINGTTTADDLGMGRMMSTRKDFIGRVLAQRPALTDPERAVLVGLRPVNHGTRLYSGAHFLARGAPATLESDQGYMTSVTFSPMLGHWIGLGMLRRGRERQGEILRAHDPVRSGDTEVEVVSPVFFDPEGVRLHQ